MNNLYKFSDLIVNLDDVSGISIREIVYRNGERQSISRTAADALLEWFTPSEKRWRESLQELRGKEKKSYPSMIIPHPSHTRLQNDENRLQNAPRSRNAH